MALPVRKKGGHSSSRFHLAGVKDEFIEPLGLNSTTDVVQIHSDRARQALTSEGMTFHAARIDQFATDFGEPITAAKHRLFTGSIAPVRFRKKPDQICDLISFVRRHPNRHERPSRRRLGGEQRFERSGQKLVADGSERWRQSPLITEIDVSSGFKVRFAKSTDATEYFTIFRTTSLVTRVAIQLQHPMLHRCAGCWCAGCWCAGCVQLVKSRVDGMPLQIVEPVTRHSRPRLLQTAGHGIDSQLGKRFGELF